MEAFRVADCRVRPSEHVIERDGVPLQVEPRTMALLLLLVERAGEVVSRQEIEETVWAGRVVGYDALTQTIAKLRRALGDDSHRPRYVVTVPKGGYQLVAPVMPDDDALPQAEPPVPIPQPSRARWPVGLAVVVLTALVGAVVGWWGLHPAATAPTDPARGRPSIAVLPFVNHSEGGARPHLAEGLTEDLNLSLTRVPELFVIANNSALAFQDRPLDIAAVRRQLGVRYAVVGSVQSAGSAIRVQAQLIDAESGNQLWAQRYDQPQGDLFAIQDQISDAIATRVLPQVQEAEKRRARHKPTENLDAYDLFQRARSEKHKLNAEGEAKATELLRQAIVLDPNFAEAHVLLGWTSGLLRVFTGGGPSFEESLARIHRGLELNSNLSIGYQALAQVLTFMKRHEEAAKAGLKAIEINPNDAENHIMFSRAASTAGWYRQAVESAQKAIELNPLYPKWYPFIYSRALYADGQDARAVDVCIDGMARQAFIGTAAMCIAALERVGRHDEAVRMVQTLRTMAPQMGLELVLESYGFKDDKLHQRFGRELGAAGLA
ncbi:Transcriptional activator CadC [Azoarcus sp. Aa7]|nr:Transcriptional activator CadC [Azoarcus sp. Aa7]